MQDRWRLPKSIMEPDATAEVSKTPVAEIKRIIGQELPRMASSYEQILAEDGSYFKQEELSTGSRREQRDHRGQLVLLQGFLVQFAQNPASFEPRVQDVDLDKGTCTARLKRKQDGPYGEGEENSQTQLGFHTQNKPRAETEREAIVAESLKGVAPEETLRRVHEQIALESVTINTVKVFRGPRGTQIIPQAGIRIALYRGNVLGVSGVKYVGTIPHFTEEGEVQLPENFTIKEYQVLKSLGMQLAGYKSQQASSKSPLKRR